jgi:hypothetical protein
MALRQEVGISGAGVRTALLDGMEDAFVRCPVAGRGPALSILLIIVIIIVVLVILGFFGRSRF